MEYFMQDGEALKTKYFNGRGYENNAIRPIFRSGIHYAAAKYTHFRASIGQGIRYPTVAERYTSTSVGSLNIFPNPELQAETGWAGEIGLKQGLKLGEWKGFIDLSGFINSYQNMMEFTLGVYNPDSIPLSGNPNSPGYIGKWVGFRAENAEAAQITGFEASINGMGMIGPIKVQTLMGYTYMNPISKNYNPDYRETFSNDSTDILKYRFKHLAKADLQLEFKGFSVGGSMRMNSFMVNIDKAFEDGILNQQILPGLKQYRRDHDGATVVFDARVGYEYKEKYKLNLIVNNVANTEYMTRPGDMQAPRCFIVQLSFKL
jgi:iron complex outermembrane receptor protein